MHKQGTLEEIDDLAVLTTDQRKAWLESSENWGAPWFGAKWIGKKILGLSVNGLIGLWAHQVPTSEEIEIRGLPKWLSSRPKSLIKFWGGGRAVEIHQGTNGIETC